MARSLLIRFFYVLVTIGCFLSCSKPDSSQQKITLFNDWHLCSSATITADGKTISSQDYELEGWQKTPVPSTVLAALVENGVYENPYFGKNLLKIDTDQFQQSWWYRVEFKVDKNSVQQYARLMFDGINYSANIWLNGALLADSDSVIGSFRRFEFDVSEKLNAGNNVLAVEVIPPKPGDFTIGFVDWNPRPPDENMGIWRDVRLVFSGAVSINHPFVSSTVDLETLKKAELTISAELHNSSDQNVSGKLVGKIEDLEFEKSITLKPYEQRTEYFTADDFDQLNISNPRLWWPNNHGEPNLYTLDLRFISNGAALDEKSLTFGIRHVSDYKNESGHRGYKINGRPILIKGGGWVDDLLLADTPEKIEAQVKYAKDMNLNTIRLEGFWGKDHTIYNLCDKYGILLMVGWSCHWEWEEYIGKPCDEFGGITTPEEMDLMAASLKDQIVWLRNHPSIFVWVVGSDKLPRPELERKYIDIFENYDQSRPYLGAAMGLKSEISGPTGVKMKGPYAYTSPVYWYEDKENGGAYGFNTETGPGAQVPPIESIKKMIPEEHLWPIDHYWEYHCGRNNFNTLARYQKALDLRYGAVDNVDDFAKKAQVMNYELMRPMFEAFAVNNGEATGIIQWMFNSSWPEMYWQFFDSYLMPTGAYFAAKKANQPLHIVYNYGDKSIYLVNEHAKSFRDLKAVIRIFNIESKELFNESVTINIQPSSAKNIFISELFNLDKIKDLSTAYFLHLSLLDTEREEITSNFYWLSTTPDVPDYEATEWYYTPIKRYADLTKLNDLPNIKINVQQTVEQINDTQQVKIQLDNNSDAIAFFIEMQLIGKKSGETILPVFWDDNYISLLPGEKRELFARVANKDLNGEKFELKLSGWNVTVE